jgi:hypothetical protein
MKKFLRIAYDAVVFAVFIFFIVGVYKRFWLPPEWFKPWD